eukprot:3863724-Alexandrium_andersonii.AAC.1
MVAGPLVKIAVLVVALLVMIHSLSARSLPARRAGRHAGSALPSQSHGVRCWSAMTMPMRLQ